MTKKALLQLNIADGLGDLLSDFLSCIEFAKKLKRENFNVRLEYSLFNHFYPEGPSILEKVFAPSMFSIFDEVQETPSSRKELKQDDLIYFNQGACGKTPGLHHVDLYFNTIPDSAEMSAYNATRVFYDKEKYDGIITFTDLVEQYVQEFINLIPKEYYFLHIRRATTDNQQYIVDKIKSYLHTNCNNVPIHIGTHQQYIIDSLLQEKNIYTYNFKNKFLHLLPYNPQNNRFIETCAEMASIRNAKKILAYSEYPWVSNFLHYALYKGVECEQITI